MKRLLSAAAALSVFAATPAASLAGPVTLPAAPAPSAHALALAQSYMDTVHLQRQIDTVLKRVLPAMLDQLMASQTNLSASDRKLLIDAVTDSENEAMKPVLIEYLAEMKVVVAQTFTEEELQQAIAFYRTPVGQSMLAKSALLTERGTHIMSALMPQFQADMQARLSARLATIIEQKKREAQNKPT